MKTPLDWFIAILLIVIGTLALSFVGTILAFMFIVVSLRQKTTYRPSGPTTPTAEQSIRSAWEKSDRTNVPEDIRTEYRLYLQSPEWKTLRQLALKRDSHRCTQCGYIGYGLQAHHTNYDGIYTMTFTIDQLITVCADCHTKIHRR